MRLGIRITGMGVALAFSTVALADSMELAMQLGSVLGSEAFCSLSYDQAFIREFIEKRVKADDMQFTSSLSLMSNGAEYQNQQMSASQKTAHCAQIARVAKSYGFTK